MGQGPPKWGALTLGGTKDDFLGYRKKLLDLLCVLLICLESIFLLIMMNDLFFSFVTGGIQGQRNLQITALDCQLYVGAGDSSVSFSVLPPTPAGGHAEDAQ